PITDWPENLETMDKPYVRVIDGSYRLGTVVNAPHILQPQILQIEPDFHIIDHPTKILMSDIEEHRIRVVLSLKDSILGSDILCRGERSFVFMSSDSFRYFISLNKSDNYNFSILELVDSYLRFKQRDEFGANISFGKFLFDSDSRKIKIIYHDHFDETCLFGKKISDDLQLENYLNWLLGGVDLDKINLARAGNLVSG
ncbi:MAG: hypothetical protein M1530_00525, partial [Candidatus Marsarchaeota archaeon]|nr:hypothetical protein [Candidatus Marsarchaeota archaeon]